MLRKPYTLHFPTPDVFFACFVSETAASFECSVTGLKESHALGCRKYLLKMTIPDFLGKNTDFKILWDHKKSIAFLYTNNEKSKMKLRNNSSYNNIKKNKILRNKLAKEVQD